MSQKTIARLERLQHLNSNRLMDQEDLYIIAYERIKAKPSNMTPGTDDETLDGFSLAMIHEIIAKMKTEQFRFRPVRQQFIPKPNVLKTVYTRLMQVFGETLKTCMSRVYTVFNTKRAFCRRTSFSGAIPS